MYDQQKTSIHQLEYEAQFSEEELPDGTRRITVVSDSKRIAKNMAVFAAIGLIATLVCGLLFLTTELPKAGFYLMAIGPLELILMVVAIVLQIKTPRKQSHLVELSGSGLILRSFFMGDPVTRHHLWGEIHQVKSNGITLEIHVAKDQYTCMNGVRPQHLRTIAAMINEVLAAKQLFKQYKDNAIQKA